MSSPTFSVDLKECDSEPVARIEAVQTYGFFIAVDRSSLTVSGHSDNITDFVGQPRHPIVNGQLKDFLNAESARRVSAIIREGVADERKSLDSAIVVNGKTFLVSVFEISSHDVGIEFEPASIEPADKSTTRSRIFAEVSETLKNAKDVKQVGKACCAVIRKMTGLERVMLYRFSQDDWHGEVIAEDRSAQSHSYLDHRFPADDIPLPARQLYLKNRVRFIFDSTAPSSALISGRALKTSYDLSNSRIRAVAPVHLEYLQNMGVKTSFSIAVIVDGALWGLFACHHGESLYIGPEDRADCTTIANFCASFCSLLEHNESGNQLVAFAPQLFRLIHDIMLMPDPIDALFRSGQKVLSLFSASGMALVKNDGVDIFGMAPTVADCRELVNQLRQTHEFKSDVRIIAMTSMNHLADSWAELAPIASGVAAVALGTGENSAVFMLFRPESLQTIKWGGDPHKNVRKRNYEGRINPRLSFATWTETVRNTAQRWTDFELDGLAHLKDIVLSGADGRDALARDLKHQLSGS